MHIYLQTYIHSHIHTYLHSHIHTYLHTHIFTNSHEYIHSFRHINIYVFLEVIKKANYLFAVETGISKSVKKRHQCYKMFSLSPTSWQIYFSICLWQALGWSLPEWSIFEVLPSWLCSWPKLKMLNQGSIS